MNYCFEQHAGAHTGGRCWVVGNGPSLNLLNLDLIQDQTSIAMNRIPLIYPQTTWRPSYYLFCSTNIGHKTWGADWTKSVIEACEEPKTTSFLSTKAYRGLKHEFVNKKVYQFGSMTERGINDPNAVSDNAIERVDKSGTSMSPAIQIMACMGVRQIFIIGADLGWRTTDHTRHVDPNHFDSSYMANISNGEWENYNVMTAHRNLKAMLDKAGIECYNASARSMLNVYPLVNYEDVVSEEWKFEGEPENKKAMREHNDAYWASNKYVEGT